MFVYPIVKSLLRYYTSKTTDQIVCNSGKASGGGSTVNVPSEEIVTPLPPLSEPMPNLPILKYATALPEHSHTQVTTLPNGLKVASEKRFGQFCTVGGKFYQQCHTSVGNNICFHH